MYCREDLGRDDVLYRELAYARAGVLGKLHIGQQLDRLLDSLLPSPRECSSTQNTDLLCVVNY